MLIKPVLICTQENHDDLDLFMYSTLFYFILFFLREDARTWSIFSARRGWRRPLSVVTNRPFF